MSKTANTSLIGVFVLGGLFLLIIFIGLFGSGQFNSKKVEFVCFFEDSVNGLDIGSPVKFKGVTVGKVSQVLLRLEGQTLGDNAVPVVIEIDEKTLSSRGIIEHFNDKQKREEIIARGLRGRLQQLSIITGMLYVEFDFYPNTPVKYHKKNPERGRIEIPTTSSNLGTVVRAATATLEQLSQIKFDVLVAKVNKILDQVNEGVARIDFKGINQGITNVTDSAQDLLQNEDVRQAASNLNAALKEFEILTGKLSAQVDPVSADLHQTSAETRKTLERINQAAENLRLATQPGTGLRAELDETLKQIADAAQAIRTLSNYLERNPNAIITGKAQPHEEEKK